MLTHCMMLTLVIANRRVGNSPVLMRGRWLVPSGLQPRTDSGYRCYFQNSPRRLKSGRAGRDVLRGCSASTVGLMKTWPITGSIVCAFVAVCLGSCLGTVGNLWEFGIWMTLLRRDQTQI